MKRLMAVNIFRTLSVLNLRELPKQALFVIMRTLRALRPIAEEWEKSEKDAAERLRPENAEALALELKHADTTPERKEEISQIERKYSADVDEFMNGLADEEVDVALERIDEDAFYALIRGAKSAPGGMLIPLYDHILQQPALPAPDTPEEK